MAKVRLAEMQALKAQSEIQVEQQKRLAAIQMEIIKRCADRGDIPVFTNGNVDCKVVK
jgi:hypothetical protein